MCQTWQAIPSDWQGDRWGCRNTDSGKKQRNSRPCTALSQQWFILHVPMKTKIWFSIPFLIFENAKSTLNQALVSYMITSAGTVFYGILGKYVGTVMVLRKLFLIWRWALHLYNSAPYKQKQYNINLFSLSVESF